MGPSENGRAMSSDADMDALEDDGFPSEAGALQQTAVLTRRLEAMAAELHEEARRERILHAQVAMAGANREELRSRAQSLEERVSEAEAQQVEGLQVENRLAACKQKRDELQEARFEQDQELDSLKAELQKERTAYNDILAQLNDLQAESNDIQRRVESLMETNALGAQTTASQDNVEPNRSNGVGFRGTSPRASEESASDDSAFRSMLTEKEVSYSVSASAASVGPGQNARRRPAPRFQSPQASPLASPESATRETTVDFSESDGKAREQPKAATLKKRVSFDDRPIESPRGMPLDSASPQLQGLRTRHLSPILKSTSTVSTSSSSSRQANSMVEVNSQSDDEEDAAPGGPSALRSAIKALQDELGTCSSSSNSDLSHYHMQADSAVRGPGTALSLQSTRVVSPALPVRRTVLEGGSPGQWGAESEEWTTQGHVRGGYSAAAAGMPMTSQVSSAQQVAWRPQLGQPVGKGYAFGAPWPGHSRR